jgi:hypothetical protein
LWINVQSRDKWRKVIQDSQFHPGMWYQRKKKMNYLRIQHLIDRLGFTVRCTIVYVVKIISKITTWAFSDLWTANIWNVHHYAIRCCRNRILKFLTMRVPCRDTKFSSSVDEEPSRADW